MEALVGFTFSIEYQKGRGNAVADTLSHVVSKLNTEAVKSILDGVTKGPLEGPKPMTQRWLRPIKEYISKVKKLQSKDVPLTCM